MVQTRGNKIWFHRNITKILFIYGFPIFAACTSIYDIDLLTFHTKKKNTDLKKENKKEHLRVRLKEMKGELLKLGYIRLV